MQGSEMKFAYTERIIAAVFKSSFLVCHLSTRDKTVRKKQACNVLKEIEIADDGG